MSVVAERPAEGAPERREPAAGVAMTALPRFSAERVLARPALLLVGGVALGGLAFLLSLALVTEGAAFAAFMVGLEPDVLVRRDVEKVLAAMALAGGALVAAWAGFSRPAGRRWWSDLSIPAAVAALDRRRWAIATIALMASGYIAYARLVFMYHRIAGGADEGMYLVTAREAMSGKLTYRDFPFIQGPLHPYLIGVFLAPFSFDEHAARIFASATTLLAMLVAAAAATRLGGRLAGVIAFAMLVTQIDFIRDLSSGVHPSGPTGALLVSLGALAFAYDRPRLGIVAFAVLTGTRVLFAPLAVLAVLAAAVRLRTARGPLFLGGALALLIFGPFLAAAPSVAWFDIIGHQSQRAALLPRLADGVLLSLRTQVQGIQAAALAQIAIYWPALMALLAVATFLVWGEGRRWLGGHRTLVLGFCVVGSVAMFLVDLLPYPPFSIYPVPQLPLLAIAGGTLFGRVLGQREWPAVPYVLAPLVSVLLLLTPFMATREAAGQPNFVEQNRKQPPVAGLDKIASFVRASTPPDGVIITLETSVATQSGRRLWPGLEVNSWGILNLPDDDAKAVHMLTPKLLAEAVESGQASAVVTSKRYTFDLPRLPTSERIKRALETRYTVAKEFDDIGDWGAVDVYLPKPS